MLIVLAIPIGILYSIGHGEEVADANKRAAAFTTTTEPPPPTRPTVPANWTPTTLLPTDDEPKLTSKNDFRTAAYQVQTALKPCEQSLPGNTGCQAGIQTARTVLDALDPPPMTEMFTQFAQDIHDLETQLNLIYRCTNPSEFAGNVDCRNANDELEYATQNIRGDAEY